MNILHVIPYYYPETGGAEKYAIEVSRYQAKKHNVHVLTIRKNRWPEKEVLHNVKIHRISFRKLPFLKQLLFIKPAVKAGTEIAQKEKIDIIHAHLDYPSSIIASKIKMKTKIPYILTVQGMSSFTYTKYPIIRGMVLRALRTCNHCLPVSKALETRMTELGYPKDKMQIIPSGVNLEEFSKAPGKKEGKTILCIARYVPEKGIQHLIMAGKHLKDRGYDFKIRLVGYGWYEKSLRALVKKTGMKKNVQFVGEVPFESIPQEVNKADIFVLPSLSEGLGIVLLEAMAGALPIVASDTGGIPDMVKEGYNGFLAQPGDPKAIADKCRLLIDDPKLQRKLGNNGIKFIRENGLEWKSVSEKIRDIYEKTAKQNIRTFH